MESTPKNTQESLQTALDEAALAVALPVGRRLFENGHFAFATLSASAHLPLSEAKLVVTPQDIRTMLPHRLPEEASLLAGLSFLRTALQTLWNRTEAFFVHLATSELNHVDALPVSTARLAGDALAYLASAQPTVPEGHAVSQAAAAWGARLAQALAKPSSSPTDFSGFLTLNEEATLRKEVFLALVSAETLGRALQSFAKIRLTSLAAAHPERAGSPGWLAAHTHARKALFNAVLDGEPMFASQGHAALLADHSLETCLATEALLHHGQTLLGLLRQDVEASRLTKAGSGHRDLALENAAYVASLERQLLLQGIETDDAKTLVHEALAYASHHGSPCADLLDDEMLRMAPRVSREALVRARLHVRHDDRDYPLSVAARNSVLELCSLGSSSSPSSSGARS